METEILQNLMQMAKAYFGSNWILSVLIAVVAAFITSVLIKPVIRKVLTTKQRKANSLIDSVRRDYEEELAKDESTMFPDIKELHDSRLASYKAQLAEYTKAVDPSWMSDKMSNACFMSVIILCFLGAVLHLGIQMRSLVCLEQAYTYIYALALIAVEEFIYAAYEKFGIKGLYKKLSGNLKL